jgi:hypothetical protein
MSRDPAARASVSTTVYSIAETAAMTQDEISQRVAWLERKMVRVLWLLISGSSMLLGWVMASATGEHGWTWGAVFIVTWLTTGFIVQRIEFRGAPSHIEFLDP